MPKLKTDKAAEQNFLYLDPTPSNYDYNISDSFIQRYPSQDDLYNNRGDSFQYFNEPNFIFSRQPTFNPANYEEPPGDLNKLHMNQTSFKHLLRNSSFK
jgi:hypothetical protein